MKETRQQMRDREVAEQTAWIRDHGRTAQGYIEHYGASYGEEGALAIYRADSDRLLTLLDRATR